MRNQRRIWTKKHLDKLKAFIEKNKEGLKNNFYTNILENNLKHRKIFHFFNDMSSSIGRSVPECKSKFQKFERVIYEEYLGIPSVHFELFLFLRKKRRITIAQNKPASKKNTKNNLILVEEMLKMERIRNEIIEMIFTKKINIGLDEESLGINC